MRPPRFRLRTLMIAVAIVALIAVHFARERVWSYRRYALAHAAEERRARDLERSATGPKERAIYADRAAYHARLRDWWERAAGRPWDLLPAKPAIPPPP